MRYTILIVGIDNPRARKIVAHNLAGNRSISLTYAQSLLENVPVIYQTDLMKEDAEVKLRQLTAIGVRGSIVPADVKAALPGENRGDATPLPQPAASAETIQSSPPAMGSAPLPGHSFVYRENTASVPPLGNETMKKRLIATGMAVLFLLGTAVFIYVGKKWHMHLMHMHLMHMHFNAPAISFSGADAKQPRGRTAARPPFNDKGKKAESPGEGLRSTPSVDRLRANAYADSGKACADRRGAVAFYKMAIAINKYNVDAWYGLLAAYTALGMAEEAQTTKDEMAAIFGEEIFSVSKTVERFGDLLDVYNTADGTFHVEYRSRESEKEALLHETFLLAKAFGARKNAMAFSFYAHAARGRGGVLVYVSGASGTSGNPVPDTYQQYRSQATVTMFE